jgi:hypothetical protein
MYSDLAFQNNGKVFIYYNPNIYDEKSDIVLQMSEILNSELHHIPKENRVYLPYNQENINKLHNLSDCREVEERC